jgi:hypothetical protein
MKVAATERPIANFRLAGDRAGNIFQGLIAESYQVFLVEAIGKMINNESIKTTIVNRLGRQIFNRTFNCLFVIYL